MPVGSKRDWLLVTVAVVAGGVAAAAGGLTEDILDWAFVGVPLLVLAAAAVVTFVVRWRARR